MLLDLVSEWAVIVNERAAAERMAELRAEVNEMWFAWSGPAAALPRCMGTRCIAMPRMIAARGTRANEALHFRYGDRLGRARRHACAPAP
jgi:hypothetical protein